MAFRRGMWVVYNGQTGIIYQFRLDGYIEVHLVDAEGDTTSSVAAQESEIRQALRSEIPEARRPSPEDAIKFGYL